jgi:succinoglycan biosynthesis protein ExoU
MDINESGVCVIIAAFNAQNTIARAVKSALQQDCIREVIVADDASRDDTARRARMQDDGSGRLAVITLTENKGPAAARNAALAHSNSPYVCLLDADDYFLPDRISRLLTAADSSSWDIIADDILIVPEDQEYLEFSILKSGSPQPHETLDLETFVRGNISYPQRPRGELGFLKPIIKRAFLRQHGLAYNEEFRLGEDYVLYTQALIAGARFFLANACGYVAIERNESISSRHSARDLERIITFDDECFKDPRLSTKARTALAAHREATLRKYNYRRVLDCKQDLGPLRALALLATMPTSMPYILAETIRAKTMRRAGGDPRGTRPCSRFLVGMPEMQFTLSGSVPSDAHNPAPKGASFYK